VFKYAFITSQVVGVIARKLIKTIYKEESKDDSLKTIAAFIHGKFL
jgi:hypothetical protein